MSPVRPAPVELPIQDDIPEPAGVGSSEVLVVAVDPVLAVMARDLDRFPVVGGASINPLVHDVLLDRTIDRVDGSPFTLD